MDGEAVRGNQVKNVEHREQFKGVISMRGSSGADRDSQADQLSLLIKGFWKEKEKT